MLLPWLAMTGKPLCSIGGFSKGDPLAKMQRPPVALKAASAVHSARSVGLLMGMIVGRSVLSAIAWSTSAVKIPPTPESPKRIVGLTFRMVSVSDMPSSRSSRANPQTASESPSREAPMRPSLSSM